MQYHKPTGKGRHGGCALPKHGLVLQYWALKARPSRCLSRRVRLIAPLLHRNLPRHFSLSIARITCATSAAAVSRDAVPVPPCLRQSDASFSASVFCRAVLSAALESSAGRPPPAKLQGVDLFSWGTWKCFLGGIVSAQKLFKVRPGPSAERDPLRHYFWRNRSGGR